MVFNPGKDISTVRGNTYLLFKPMQLQNFLDSKGKSGLWLISLKHKNSLQTLMPDFNCHQYWDIDEVFFLTVDDLVPKNV